MHGHFFTESSQQIHIIAQMSSGSGYNDLANCSGWMSDEDHFWPKLSSPAEPVLTPRFLAIRMPNHDLMRNKVSTTGVPSMKCEGPVHV